MLDTKDLHPPITSSGFKKGIVKMYQFDGGYAARVSITDLRYGYSFSFLLAGNSFLLRVCRFCAWKKAVTADGNRICGDRLFLLPKVLSLAWGVIVRSVPVAGSRTPCYVRPVFITLDYLATNQIPTTHHPQAVSLDARNPLLRILRRNKQSR